MKELIVGIDLGTTNSALAVVIDGETRVVPIHGQSTLPSCVGLDPTGKLIVGQTARNQLVASPDSTVLSIKRKMGEDIRVRLGDREYSPEEISSFILRELKVEGEKALGQPIHKAVITVPAFFNERQRKATQVAGELAGLDVVRIINEPTAAALAYGAGQTDDHKMLVYDLGGGTFDVSLVLVEQAVVEVKASHGDTHLGGDDFDQLLVEFALAEFQKQHAIDLRENPAVLRRLKLALEQAKCRLSDEPFVRVREEYLSGEHHLELELERDQYERLIGPLVDKTLTCLHQSLEDAKLTRADLDKVMLVGGSTRTPLVQRVLLERLEIEPRWEINPDLIVAMGAAVQGAIIAGDSRRSILVDITPHTFSTAAVVSSGFQDRLICSPIIRRNTPLPASKSEVYFTMYDNQDSINVAAYQGENLDPDNNTLIGEFMVEGLSKAPAGNPIIIHFELDLNGMLKVTAAEKNSSLAKTVTLDTRHAGGNINLEEARRNVASILAASEAHEPISGAVPAGDAAAILTPDSVDLDPNELLLTAKDLRKRGEALLEKNINPDDAGEIRTLMHDSANAIKERDWSALGRINDTLSDLIFYLED
jgi:molecular chaperone DnaK